MAELILMTRGFERMNVPADKLQEYLDAGWTEISRQAVAEESTEAKKAKTESTKKPAEK